MYYMKNSEKKWCPCDSTQKNFIYANKPNTPVYAPVTISLNQSPRRFRRFVYSPPSKVATRTAPVGTSPSSQVVAPDVNVNIPPSVERYTGFVPYSARKAVVRRERFVEPTAGDSLVVDYGNAIEPPTVSNISAAQYEAALDAFYSALGMPTTEYDYSQPKLHTGPIPIEATAYASLPSEYAENFTPIQVNRYGTVSKWR